MKKKSSKLAALEKNRFSILTDDLDRCYICGRKRDNLHEVYEGAKRIPSMKYGCVLPLCYPCHVRIHSDRNMALLYKRTFQVKFMTIYPELKFIDIFKVNYL